MWGPCMGDVSHMVFVCTGVFGQPDRAATWEDSEYGSGKDPCGSKDNATGGFVGSSETDWESSPTAA